MAQTQSDRFEVRMTSDSHFGWIRTRLSVERTMMAWLRTGVSMIGFGFTIVQFFEHLNTMAGVAPAYRPETPRYLGLSLIGAGVLTLIISGIQFRRVVRYLWQEPYRALAGISATGHMAPVAEQTPTLVITIVLALIGLVAFSAVLLRVT
jgi:putative membrane protein